MIWWIGAGIFYIIVLAAICLFFEGAKEPPENFGENKNKTSKRNLKIHKARTSIEISSDF